MKFIRINSKDNPYFNDAMEIYKTSFPIFEQRTIKSQIEVLDHEDYYCMAVCECSKLIGILFYWKGNAFRYIEHLAISKELRGQNYGSKVLKEFCKNNKNIILEIDIPNDFISIKRLHFYSKLGFKLQEFNHVHPPYREAYKGHSLKIMSFEKDLTQKEYDQFNMFLINTIMKFSEENINKT